jgi:predicted DNA-binding transcriptional regulator YafY
VAVKALRAGERVEEQKPSSGLGPRATTTETMTLLNEALLKQREVWIGYADKSGMTTERIVEPLSITAGFLTAFDVRNSEVHTFTISRITGAAYVQDSVEGSAS